MRHLLVPLDGSGFGETALALAAAIADRKGWALEIVTVHAPTAHPDFSAPLSSEIDTWFRTRAQEYLDCMAEQVRGRFSIELRTTVLQGGAATAIAEHALASPPELIVMCTHARSGPSRLFLGSVTDRLVRELRLAQAIPCDSQPLFSIAISPCITANSPSRLRHSPPGEKSAPNESSKPCVSNNSARWRRTTRSAWKERFCRFPRHRPSVLTPTRESPCM